MYPGSGVDDPSIIGGYITTGAISGSVLVFVNFLIGVAIYYPFVRMLEYLKDARNKKNLKALNEEVLSIETKFKTRIIDRYDIVGNLARILSKDMMYDLHYTNNFFLEYQPQVSSEGKVVGAEALLRWRHSKFGLIIPPVTILIAEESNFIEELGNWVIKNSCAQLARLRNIVDDDFVLSFNLSAEQLKKPKLVTVIERNISEYGLRPTMLKAEFTETAAIDNSMVTQETISNIHKLGVKLAIDDFGMGHSSLLYIKEYAIDTLKFDGALVKDITYNKDSQDIIGSIVKLCDTLNIDTIAEFVETQEQRDVLRSLGCNIYQGYYFSKAVPEKELIDFLKKDHYN
ncbi:EAL domain-containing protein [Brucepastera parasyntrophica]|uniref:EAL domain-containing protein n=1 Tax=Brucepastera parasyntrophica TaxID=2880008 RepID=UPI00210B5F39|nr:EAL domain-containing protein [Brucepastera parasyntrophica]ULQ61104.1 EAL domain-containing protein [Brucepastera parasyntrophica]